MAAVQADHIGFGYAEDDMNAAQLDLILFALFLVAVFGFVFWLAPKLDELEQRYRRKQRLEEWKR